MINEAKMCDFLGLKPIFAVRMFPKTWVNERLKYTHGYGIVMSPVNLVSRDGLPILFIKNIPPVSEIDLEVQQPHKE